LVAATVNVYDVPLINPGTFTDVTPPPTDTDTPPGEPVTVYPVIGEPPVSVGAVHDTNADPSPATADTPVGAPGGDAGDDEQPATAHATALSNNAHPLLV
jgi:hypothetical protein